MKYKIDSFFFHKLKNNLVDQLQKISHVVEIEHYLKNNFFYKCSTSNNHFGGIFRKYLIIFMETFFKWKNNLEHSFFFNL